MAKISKRLLNKHNEAVALLEKDKLNFYDRDFVYDFYHEGAGKMNNLISAHFTPRELARSMSQNTRCHHWVDLCAGIGILSYVMVRDIQLSHLVDKPYTAICVENCIEYYEIGKKLLPECIWINGSIFDDDVINQIKDLMEGKEFSIISNPPYGKQVKGNNKLMHYKGSLFEYKAIEIGAILGAFDGCFLIPETSAPFRMTRNLPTINESYKIPAYKKFVKETGLEIIANMGYTTELSDEDYGWKDVSIRTEIAIVEYDELDYKPTTIKERIKERAKYAGVTIPGGYVIDCSVDEIEIKPNEQLKLWQ